MQIVIPGALPPEPAAQSLMPYMAQRTPKLTRWFAGCSAHVQRINLLETACTMPEYWAFTQKHAFVPTEKQNFSSGLGPFLEPNTQQPDAPVWIAELVHVSPSRDGAALLGANQLGITQQESVSLFEAAHEIFLRYGFSLHLGRQPWHWVATPPQNMSLPSVSPKLVAHTRVNDWWPQDTASRPWRQLVNELQMTWHEHPVNRSRNEAGQAAVNSIWLFGGATTNQLKRRENAPTIQWHDDLLESFLAQDWGQWIQQLEQLSSVLLNATNQTKSADFVLLGEDRVVSLRPSLVSRFRAQLPGQATHWRNWWSPRS